MSRTNYRNISRAGSEINAGFQFEFNCGNCARTWKSPYKPYRRGQLSGLIYKLAYFLDSRGKLSRASGVVADAGMKGAQEAALQAAIELSEQRYVECQDCEKAVCLDCWNPRTQKCEACDGKAAQSLESGGSSSTSASASRGAEARLSCPNCQAASGSGRFCAECGFDMASTHKSCPGCGAMCTRAARFCPDCGNGF